jgi:outer membrane protein OmpA-like peptidoglycan-associated protein
MTHALSTAARRPAGWAAALVPFLALFVLWAAPLAAGAQTTSLRGIISARDGAQMTVRTSDGADTVFTLTESTRVVATTGALNIRSDELPASELLNGLPVSVEAVRNGEQLDAVTVTFKQSDLKTARQIDTGTAQAKEKVREKAAQLEAENEALKKRLSEANQYVDKGSISVLFATGSATITTQGKADLRAIAAKAKTIKGYLIGVTGHADTTGDSKANQALSERRAMAVIRFLQKSCDVQPYRVLASNAMGDVKLAAEETTAEGRALNRRVVVQILVNKGLEGL